MRTDGFRQTKKIKWDAFHMAERCDSESNCLTLKISSERLRRTNEGVCSLSSLVFRLNRVRRCRSNSKSIASLAETYRNDISHDTDNVCLGPQKSTPILSITQKNCFHQNLLQCALKITFLPAIKL
jgi:hypothetical protein